MESTVVNACCMYSVSLYDTHYRGKTGCVPLPLSSMWCIFCVRDVLQRAAQSQEFKCVEL